MEGWWLVGLGTVAGICTTGSFVPQLLKCWKLGDAEAVSFRMFALRCVGLALWCGYGFFGGACRSWCSARAAWCSAARSWC